jgi:hypothetical protein
MSAPANSKRAAIGVKNLCKPAKNGVIEESVSYVETYSLTTDSQTEFWT